MDNEPTAAVASAPVVPAENKTEDDAAQKHFLAVFFLSFMWGMFGVDRFYLGKIGTGILKLITFGGFGLWVLIDLVLIMSGSMRDRAGRPMREYERYKKFAGKTVLIFAIVVGATTLISGLLSIWGLYEAANQLLHGGTQLQQLLPSGTDLNSLQNL